MDYYRKNKHIITEFVIALIFFICVIVILDDILLPIDLENKQVEHIVSIISSLLYFIAIGSSIYYYKQKDNYIIFFYTIYMISLFMLSIFTFKSDHIGTDLNKLFFVNFFLINQFTILMTALPTNKIKKIVSSNKWIFLLVILFLNSIICFIEQSFIVSNFLAQMKITQIIIISSIIIYLAIIFVYFAKFLDSKDYIYPLLSLVLLSSCIKALIVIVIRNEIYQYDKYLTLLIVMTYITLVIYSGGLLFLSSYNVKSKLKNIQDLDLFYNILDNKFNNKEIYLFDEEENVIYVNEEVRTKYNLNENSENILGNISNICKSVKSKVEEETIFEIERCLKENKHFQGLIKRDKQEQWYLEIDEVISKIHGVVYIVKVNSNKEIANLKRQIEDKNAIFEIITKQFRDLVIIVDSCNNIKYVNNECCEMLGQNRDVLITKNIEDIASNILLSDKEDIQEVSFERDNGEVLDTEMISYPINDDDENGWMFIGKDVTYKRNFKNLEEKYDEIKVYNEFKSDFFANLSHELKTPLNIFYSIIQILDLNVEKNEDNFKEIYTRYNKGLKVNFYRMFKMITNLIDLTKFDSNLEQVRFQNYDIVRLCEDISLSIITYAQQKDIELIFDTQREEEIIRCNGEYMERIMLNLLSNAIKFTPKGGTIKVDLLFDEKFVHIKVKDSGVGIPKEKINEIFGKFTRVDKTIKRENEGSGIGLSIVKSLVQLLEGKISLKSEEDRGSEFTISLPNKKLSENDLCECPVDYIVDTQKITLELSDIYDAL